MEPNNTQVSFNISKLLCSVMVDDHPIIIQYSRYYLLHIKLYECLGKFRRFLERGISSNSTGPEIFLQKSRICLLENDPKIAMQMAMKAVEIGAEQDPKPLFCKIFTRQTYICLSYFSTFRCHSLLYRIE